MILFLFPVPLSMVLKHAYIISFYSSLFPLVIYFEGMRAKVNVCDVNLLLRVVESEHENQTICICVERNIGCILHFYATSYV